MSEKYTNYEPNDYEQMLIAAGWITAESVDSEYQSYLRSTVWLQREFDDFEPMSYEGWRSMRKEHERLNQQYETEIQPYYDSHKDGNIPYKVREVETRLLRDMDWVETCLGY